MDYFTSTFWQRGLPMLQGGRWCLIYIISFVCVPASNTVWFSVTLCPAVWLTVVISELVDVTFQSISAAVSTVSHAALTSKLTTIWLLLGGGGHRHRDIAWRTKWLCVFQPAVVSVCLEIYPSLHHCLSVAVLRMYPSSVHYVHTVGEAPWNFNANWSQWRCVDTGV